MEEDIKLGIMEGMNFIQFFDDPEQIAKPRQEVRFLGLQTQPYEDGRRLLVMFELTPFLERPSLELAIVNENGESAGTLHIIEALQPNFQLTIHLRDKQPTSFYTLYAQLYYAALEGDRLLVDQKKISFTINPNA